MKTATETVTVENFDEDEIYDIECELMKEYEFFQIINSGKVTHYQVHNFQTDSDYVFQSDSVSEMSDRYQEQLN